MIILRKTGLNAIIELSSSSVKLVLGSPLYKSLSQFYTEDNRTETTAGLRGDYMDLGWYEKNVLPTIKKYFDICMKKGVESIILTATAVYRKSKNCDKIFDLIEETIGIRPILLSGKEEAELAPLAFMTLNPKSKGKWLLFIDQGRGSTELTLIDPLKNTADKYSFPYGNGDIRSYGDKNILKRFEDDRKVQNILREARKRNALFIGSGGVLTKRLGLKDGQKVKENQLKCDENLTVLFKYIISGGNELIINGSTSEFGAFFKYYKR